MKKYLYLLTILSLICSSCVMKTLHDPPENPDIPENQEQPQEPEEPERPEKSLPRLVVELDWQYIDPEVDSLIIEIDGNISHVVKNHIPDTLEINSGNHTISTYNKASKIIVSHGMATFDTIGTTGDRIFYSASSSFTAVEDSVHIVELTPLQRNYILKISPFPPLDSIFSGKIKTANLGPIATFYDIINDVYSTPDSLMTRTVNDIFNFNMFKPLGNEQRLSIVIQSDTTYYISYDITNDITNISEKNTPHTVLFDWMSHIYP